MSDRPTPVAPRYLRTSEAATHLSLSISTLEKHRCYGSGPRFYKLGGRVVYAIADLDDWAATGRKSSTSDPGVGDIPPLRPVRR